MAEWRRRLKEQWGIDVTSLHGVASLDQRVLVTKLKRFEAALREVAAAWDDLPSGVSEAFALTIEFGPEQPIPQGDQ